MIRLINILIAVFLVFPSISYGAQCSSTIPTTESCNPIVHGDITWTFSTNETVGQFANGDYYVVDDASVTLNSISPAWNSTGNGAMLNPTPDEAHGYHTNIGYLGNYSAALNVADDVPISLSAGDVLVSTTSYAGDAGTSYIDDARVLTVVSSAPSSGTFRPGYSSDGTILHNISSIDYNTLGSLAPTASVPSMASVEAYFDGLWLDHKSAWTGRYIHPHQHMQSYGRELCYELELGALMLQLNYSNATKEDLLINLIQIGIDNYSIAVNGDNYTWINDGGHSGCRKFPILLAGIVLDDTDMKAIGDKSGEYLYDGEYGANNEPPDYIHFGEDDQVFYVKDEDVTLTSGDYTGYIDMPEWCMRHTDGAEGCDPDWDVIGYRECCTMISWDGWILAAHIMGMQSLWNNDALFDYADRYNAIENGLPDPFGYTVPNEGTGWGFTGFPGEMWVEYRDDYEDNLGTTYYVTSSGSSPNGDGSVGDPWQTFDSIVWGSLGTGDTLDGQGDTYTTTLYPGASGSASAQLVIQNMNFGAAAYYAAINDTAGRDYLTFQDIIINLTGHSADEARGITTGTDDKDGWIIQRLTVRDTPTHGIWIEQADDLIVRDSLFYDSGTSGGSGNPIHLEECQDFIVERCVAYSDNERSCFASSDNATGPSGISTGVFRYNHAYFSGGGASTASYGFKISADQVGGDVDIIGNIIEDTYTGIAMQGVTSGNVYNNIINNTHYIGLYGGTTGTYSFRNNIVTNSNKDGLIVYTIDGNPTEDYDLVWTATENLYHGPSWIAYDSVGAWQAGTIYGDNNLETDPLYASNLRLVSNSPAFGAGTDVGYDEGISPDSTWPSNVIIEAVVGGPHMGPWSQSSFVAEVTGTIISGGIAESEVVSGGDTIVVELANATLVSTFGDDNAITTAFIQGLDSNLAEAGGWDAKVKATLTHAAVVRTNDTTATVTLPAIADYQITATEIVTLTIPATSTTSEEEIVATPTIPISVELQPPPVRIGMQHSSTGSSGTYSSTGQSLVK